MIEAKTGTDEVMILLDRGWTVDMIATLLDISESEIKEIITERRGDNGSGKGFTSRP